MIPMKLREVAAVTEGILSDEAHSDIVVKGVATDSREAIGSDLFVALVGEHRDGSQFLADAQRKGAAAALVASKSDTTLPQIVVGDPLASLAKLGGHIRDVLDPIVVGITGSTGKTSTKDILGGVASRRYKTVVAERSMNNEIGLPMTLLQARLGTECVVTEMGAQRIGEIAALCEVARPQIAIVTNVGEAHIGHFGTIQAIVEAKGELPASLDDGGTAVLNADDPAVMSMRKLTEAHVLTFGVSRPAWMSAQNIESDRLGRVRFFMLNEGQKLSVELGLTGRHQVSNALAAAAAGRALGMSLEDIRVGLEAAKLTPWRMEILDAGVIIVNDAYNANPTSMAAALETCREMKKPGRKLVCVLGFMAELGDLAEDAHEDVGRMAAGAVDELIVVGDDASGIAKGARAAGLGHVTQVSTKEEVLSRIAALDLSDEDIILLKASRVVRLEEIVEPIREIASK